MPIWYVSVFNLVIMLINVTLWHFSGSTISLVVGIFALTAAITGLMIIKHNARKMIWAALANTDGNAAVKWENDK